LHSLSAKQQRPLSHKALKERPQLIGPRYREIYRTSSQDCMAEQCLYATIKTNNCCNRSHTYPTIIIMSKKTLTLSMYLHETSINFNRPTSQYIHRRPDNQQPYYAYEAKRCAIKLCGGIAQVPSIC